MRLPRRLLLCAFGLTLAAGAANPSRTADAAVMPIPLAPQHEFVAIADRHVCDMLRGDAGIRGHDGGASVSTLGQVFWGYGDTYVGVSSGAPNRPNSLGYAASPTTDPAANCITTQHKRDGSGNATALLPKLAGECALWPLGMTGLQSPSVHVFYVSVSNCTNYTTNGIGLATFDGTQAPAFPSVRKGIVWPGTQDLVLGAQPFLGGASDGYLYIGLQGPTPDTNALPFANSVRIARVPATGSALEACVPATLAACQLRYWQPSTQTWVTALAADQRVFTAALGANGGAMFGYNAGLAKWLSTYTTGLLFAVRARTAATPASAWSAEETLLSYCPHFMLPGFGYCYSGYLHPQYETNGGNTIYLTMATNRFAGDAIDEFTTFLHEITLGKPVVQSVNSANQRRYALGSAPAGFAAEGAAFYASAVPISGFLPVYEWTSATGDVLLGTRQPDAAHAQRGAVLFYAPPRPVVGGYAHMYEPVYRWDRSATEHAYSPLSSLASQGYTNAGIAFYTLCGDADADYLSDCAELNSGNNPQSANLSIDGDVLLDDNGDPVINAYGQTVPLGNAQSVAQDDGTRRQDIDNCPLVANPLQDNSDSGPIATNAPTGPDATNPNADVLGDACDPDTDNDGLTNAQEAQGCSSPPTNAVVQDTDADRWNDRYECVAGSNPASAASTPAAPLPGGDPDLDGVATSVEAVYGTDPQSADSDGDGLVDGIEVKYWSTDPLVADSDGDACSDRFEAATVNGDWTVNSADLGLVAMRFNLGTSARAFDVNRDGRVNSIDLLIVASAFGPCPAPRHIDRGHAP